MNTVPQQAGAFRIGRARANQSAHQRFIGLVTAATIEAALVYALLIGLGYAPMPTVIPPIIGTLIPPDDTTVPLPPPPEPTITAPRVETTITPDVQIQLIDPAPNNAITVTPAQPQPQSQPPEQVATIEKPPPIAFSPARALLATHTTPDYPPVSRRLGEQGTLRLKLAITPQGAISGATVVNSIGHPRLDEAAVDWVKSHWRYQPAMRGTTAVPSTADAVVTFKLQ